MYNGYVGATGCSIKTSTTGSFILNKSAVVEHGVNILLIKVSWPEKKCHMNYMWEMIVIELCCDEMVTA